MAHSVADDKLQDPFVTVGAGNYLCNPGTARVTLPELYGYLGGGQLKVLGERGSAALNYLWIMPLCEGQTPLHKHPRVFLAPHAAQPISEPMRSR